VGSHGAIYVHGEVDLVVPLCEHFSCILVNTSQAELLVNSLSQLSWCGIVFVVKMGLLCVKSGPGLGMPYSHITNAKS
jgi:hypothetical protein